MAKKITKKRTTRRKPIPSSATKIQKSSNVVKLGRTNGKPPNIKDPVSQYGFRQVFRPSEYNLIEIAMIEDGEAYVRQAFEKKTCLMFKEGEVFTGKNEDTIRYIKNRIRQIEYVTDIPWKTLLRQTGRELISKSNFFWVKVRKDSISGGSVGVRRSKPIAGYFPMGAENVFVRKDKDGKITEYEQRLPFESKPRKFKPEDVIHFKCDVKPGFTFGTPKLVPVIADIQALRRLEENIEALMYQTLFPVFQYKVGTEANPAGQINVDGQLVDEVSYVRTLIQSMPTEGGIVTPERHHIEYIGANGQIPNFQPVLTYFKNRVLAGLGISSLDIGDGDTSNRSTADSLSKSLIDSVKGYQSVMEDIINAEVITELILEADFDFDPLIEDNFVQLKFKEIDIEEQMKKNVNTQLLYNSDIIDHIEAREIVGYQPLEKWQEEYMFTERQTLRVLKTEHDMSKETMDIQYEQNLELAEQNAPVEAPAPTPAITSGSTAVKKKAQAAANSGKAKSAPTNQHGTKTGPQKSRLDQMITSESKTVEFFQKKYGKESTIYKQNKEAAKLRILKRAKIFDDEIDIKETRSYLDRYFDII